MNVIVDIIDVINRECFVLKDHTKTCINIRAHNVYSTMLSHMKTLHSSSNQADHTKLKAFVDIIDYIFDASQVIPTVYKLHTISVDMYSVSREVYGNRPVDSLLMYLVHCGTRFAIVHECKNVKYSWKSVRFEQHTDPQFSVMNYVMGGRLRTMLISRKLIKTKFMSGQWKLARV